MWLLDVETLELHEFVGSQVPAYAILSHVWGAEEVSFSEMKKAKHRAAAQQKAGFAKIKGCCARARKDGLKWAWVDSCCIDKRSSAELSEAINSMFQWYRGARLCYVYLADISNAPSPTELAGSRWFTRGWTLQELLAPRRILFFARDWIRIGCLEVAGQRAVNWFDLRAEEEKVAPAYLLAQLSTITGIPENVLSGKTALTQSPVAQRMHWASRRETTRPEDRAYSLMGLFDISMPILYGEGLDKAFTRLQYEIMSRTPDQSILAWYSPHATTYRLLAESPDDFRNSGLVTREAAGDVKVVKPTSFFMTSLGLRISLLLADDVGDDGDYYWYTSNSRFELGNGRLSPGDTALALLHCSTPADDGFPESVSLALILLDYDSEGCPIFICCRPSDGLVRSPRRDFGAAVKPMILSRNNTAGKMTAKVAVKRHEHLYDTPSVMRVLSNAIRILADQTGIELDELDHNLAFADIGVDSLMSLTLGDIIMRQLGDDTLCTRVGISQCLTIGNLKEYLLKGNPGLDYL